MRFRKGSKVEVLNKKEALTSWRGAEIISGNGHSYSVKYDSYPSTSEVLLERVSRKDIRPCPPVNVADNWEAGEVVEVFDDNSWKIATILLACGGGYYMVRLLGVSQEFRVHKFSIRVRQSWQDYEWVVMGKGLGNYADLKSRKLLTSNCYHRMSYQEVQDSVKFKSQVVDDFVAVQKNTELQESHVVSSRTLKRASPYCSLFFEEQTGNLHKLRAIEKDGRRQGMVPIAALEKVDAVAYPRENLGEKYMHASYNNRSNGYNELERRKINGIGRCVARSSENNDSESDACSVGSCTVVSKSLYKFSTGLLGVSCQDNDILCSDAESLRGSGGEGSCSLPPEEEVAVSIHRLELHAYHCTLEALYASGPLSWEKEALLTNLRFSLHISNDEHLIELKNLISVGTGVVR